VPGVDVAGGGEGGIMLQDFENQQNRNQVTRREFVRAGSLGALGMSLAGGLPPGSATAGQLPHAVEPSGFGKAKSVIVLFLYGAPSQMDTLDPKPDAPEEVRGEFKAIRTSLPGVLACEHLPNIAKNLHRFCLLRSMTHTSNNHAVSVALSGLRESIPVIEGNGNDPRHQPYFGSVLEYLWKLRGISMEATGIPVNMVLPWALNARTDPGRWQHHAAWLGRAYNPVRPVFHGTGSLEVGPASIMGTTPILTRFDPWDGVTPDSSFTFDGAKLPPDVPASRMDARRKLLVSVERSTGERVRQTRQAYDQYRDHALAMITNLALARVLDVTREPQPLRERYGLNLFAQSTLAARRLIEAGVKVVTVFWDTWIDNNAAWDTPPQPPPPAEGGPLPQARQALAGFPRRHGSPRPVGANAGPGDQRARPHARHYQDARRRSRALGGSLLGHVLRRGHQDRPGDRRHRSPGGLPGQPPDPPQRHPGHALPPARLRPTPDDDPRSDWPAHAADGRHAGPRTAGLSRKSSREKKGIPLVAFDRAFSGA